MYQLKYRLEDEYLSTTHTYTKSLGRVELKLSCMTAVDEHSPHHIWRRDGLNVLHQRQLDLLTTARTTEE